MAVRQPINMAAQKIEQDATKVKMVEQPVKMVTNKLTNQNEVPSSCRHFIQRHLVAVPLSQFLDEAMRPVSNCN